MVFLHIFPTVYSWKAVRYLHALFAPATALLHPNSQNISPKLYLTSWSQTVFKPCPTSSKVTLQSTSYKDLFGSAFHHRGTQGLSPAGCCPQYTRQPAEGSLSYGERRQRSERWGEREAGWAVRGAAGDAGGSGARAGGSSPRQDSRRGIASRHLLYHSHTQLSRLHYLHVVCFCF